MEIRHRPGARHANADSLSRYPCRQCGLTDDTETDSCFEIAASASVVNKATADVDPDSKNLNSLQDEDRDLSKIKSWVSDKKRPEFSDIKHESKVIKSLWSQWVNLEIKDSVLFRKWDNNKKVYHQVIVPLSERREILEQCHDARTSGHLGVSKTLERVRNRFYWTGLQSDVRSYVTGCPQCRKRKNRSAGKSCMQLEPTGSPLERIATYIMGPCQKLTEATNTF